MEHKSENRYKVYFKDGTSFSSNGSASGIEKSPIEEEFKWVAFHIRKELIDFDKTHADIDRIEYNLQYSETENS